MRLSDEKVEKIAEELAELLESRPDLVRIKEDVTTLERGITRFLLADLRIEDEITQEALAQMERYSRNIPPGTTEWELLLAKHKEEIAARKGYVL
jgi:hypothetical protein